MLCMKILLLFPFFYFWISSTPASSTPDGWLLALLLLSGMCWGRWQLKIVLSGISSLHIINRHAFTPWYMFFNKCEHFFIITPLSFPGLKQHITLETSYVDVRRKICYSSVKVMRKRIQQNAVIHAKAIKNFLCCSWIELNFKRVELKHILCKINFHDLFISLKESKYSCQHPPFTLSFDIILMECLGSEKFSQKHSFVLASHLWRRRKCFTFCQSVLQIFTFFIGDNSLLFLSLPFWDALDNFPHYSPH